MSETTTARYSQCDSTCTVDCGHCKGAGAPDRIAELEARPDCEESLRERVARALAGATIGAAPLDEGEWYLHFDEIQRDDHLRLADAAIRVITTPVEGAPDPAARCCEHLTGWHAAHGCLACDCSAPGLYTPSPSIGDDGMGAWTPPRTAGAKWVRLNTATGLYESWPPAPPSPMAPRVICTPVEGAPAAPDRDEDRVSDDEIREWLAAALWRISVPPEPPIPWPDRWAAALVPTVRALVASEHPTLPRIRCDRATSHVAHQCDGMPCGDWHAIAGDPS